MTRDEELGLVPFDYAEAEKNIYRVRRYDGEKACFFGCGLRVEDGTVEVDWNDEFHTTVYHPKDFHHLRLVAPHIDEDLLYFKG